MLKFVCCRRCSCKVISMILVANVAVLCLSIVIWKIYSQPELTPVIQILDGSIQGNIQYSRDGKEFWEFLGIPYGLPPVGERRYQPPEPAEPWDEKVKQVTKYPESCAQFDAFVLGGPKGQLDCLYLNVFVGMSDNKGKGIITGTSKPVMVYLHGGGYFSGGTDMCYPDFFMDHDVVLVVMSYRLGPMGFLNLQENSTASESKDTPKGNMALLDQILVLQWVQKNIARFGGSKDRVTLFGQSAGAIMTHLHVLSPKSRGLIHRAIIQSGSVLSSWGFSKRPRYTAQQYAKKLACSGNNTEDLIKCFNDPDWEQMVKYQTTLLDPLEEKNLFEPSVDGTFLSQHPKEILKSGYVPAIPTMWGLNSGEGGIRTARFDKMPELIPKLDEHWDELIGNLMIIDDHVLPSDSKIVREQYFGKCTNFSDNVKMFKENLTLTMSDAGFFNPVHRSALRHAKTGAPTFIYFYNYTSSIYPGAFNIYRAFTLDEWMPKQIKLVWTLIADLINEQIFGNEGSHLYGVSHAEDIFQLWNVYGITKWFSGSDTEFSRAVIKSLVDFANFTDNMTFRQIAWPSITEHDFSSEKDEFTLPVMLMDNSEKPQVVPEPYGERLKFWVQLGDY